MSEAPRLLNRDELLGLLHEVGEYLRERNTEAHLYVVGGAAMALTFDSRRVTRDVDAALRDVGVEFWDAVRDVGQRHGLEQTWLSTQATAFMSHEPDEAAAELNLPGLRVAVASPEHLLAMKLRALRDRDLEDLDVLFRHLGLTEPQQAADIHDRLFSEASIGYAGPDEALYAAQLVFDRAERHGRPIA